MLIGRNRGHFFLNFPFNAGPVQQLLEWGRGRGGGGGGLEKQTSKMGQLRGGGGGGGGNPRACFMHFKLTNAGIPYLLYCYLIRNDITLFSLIFKFTIIQ